jgi:putative ABC transport system permease protein
MLRNYFVIALRHLKRQLLYSTLNIVGLAVGMACSLVIFLFVYVEWSHDRHFENGDRIYRIGISFFNMGQFANGPELLGDFLPKEFEGIEAFTRFKNNGKQDIYVGDKLFNDLSYGVDSLFFKVFSYPFVEGDPSALNRPHHVVITESIAKKYFGNESALGKTLEVGKEKTPYSVSGIVKDQNENAHLKASIWLSWEVDRTKNHYWTSAATYNYVLLHESTSIDNLKKALDEIIAKQVYPASWSAQNNIDLENYLKDENSVKFYIQPLRDIYLKSKLNLELSPGGNETNLYIFSIIAIFILTLAAVNFINLSTARATRRAKEVGIRKTLGTSRTKLIYQFLVESILISLFSLVLALCFAELFVFTFYWITGQPMNISLWANNYTVIFIVTFALVTGVLAGLYPAFYLTSFQPVKVLKGNVTVSGTESFRNSLVVFQFSISIALIICTSIILQQLQFMTNKDLGFNQENVVTIDNVYGLKSTAFSFRDEMLKQPGVVNASLHSGEPGSKAIMTFNIYQTPEIETGLTISTYYGDHNYLDVMGFRLMMGRDFNKDLASDTASVILNQAAVRALNLHDNPLGSVLNKNLKVIGVVSDFHWETLHNSIAPLAILLSNEKITNTSFAQLSLKINTQNPSSILKAAETTWKKLKQDEVMSYHFVDENFGELLKKDEVLGKAIGFFTFLAILISCLGLFGLAAYTTEQRTKEIGIRKVLGASVSNIVLMLNKKFTMLVFISMFIAIPVSYYAAQQWLSEFAYHIELKPWVFIGGGLTGLAISCFTVAFHSVKASRSNPTETLKCE